MGRTKVFFKAAAVTALIIAVLSASYMGINHLALTAATGRIEILPQHIANVNLPEPNQEAQEIFTDGGIPFDTREQQVESGVSAVQDSQPEQLRESFIAPRLTFIESPFQHYFEIPNFALSMEDAALIGAYYIWDVFGESIDGLYVQMIFSALPFMSRTEWTGIVSTNIEALIPPQGAVSMYIPGRVYQFSIDGVTGERIDIWYINQDWGPPPTREDLYAHANFREAAIASGWFYMSLDEQKAKIGLTPDLLEAYTQAAKELASRHFNTSTVAEVFLGQIGSANPELTIDGGLDENGEETFVLVSLLFTAVDHTGREAIIRLPAESACWRGPNTSILTRYNDIIPGFIQHGGIG